MRDGAGPEGGHPSRVSPRRTALPGPGARARPARRRALRAGRARSAAVSCHRAGITGLHDIRDRDDCERLVRSFCGRALHDPIIGFIFTDVARLDLEEHVPKVASFWETVLLGARTYTGGAFHPHATLHAEVRLRSGHFQRWLALWHETVDAEFVGPVAEQAKTHADRVAFAFHGRLQTLTPPTDAEAPLPGLVVSRHGRPPGDPRPS